MKTRQTACYELRSKASTEMLRDDVEVNCYLITLVLAILVSLFGIHVAYFMLATVVHTVLAARSGRRKSSSGLQTVGEHKAQNAPKPLFKSRPDVPGGDKAANSSSYDPNGMSITKTKLNS
ncbi:hypothetical protein F4779DRAFT_618733 [Xylariaceae sp. FL0662B]|nr:hypothetical protein F4779DRAFT_618733 [Xylariaceae sp. FL0662B]